MKLSIKTAALAGCVTGGTPAPARTNPSGADHHALERQKTTLRQVMGRLLEPPPSNDGDAN